MMSNRPSTALIGWCACFSVMALPAMADNVPVRTIEFVTDEITKSNVDVSPDGRTLIFDALGDIYTVPIEGGTATLIVSGRSWDQKPRFSPDGARIAFFSDRDGALELWTANADGSGIARYSSPAMVEGEPPIRGDDPPGWMPGRKGPLYESGVTNQVKSSVANLVAYAKTGDKGTALVVRSPNASSAEDRVLIKSIGPLEYNEHGRGVTDFSFTPDGRSIVMGHQGKLVRVDVSTGNLQQIPVRVPVHQQVLAPISPEVRIAQSDVLRARILRWPTVAQDGKRVVFSAVGKLYVIDTKTRISRRLTSDNHLEFAPAISPDGKWVAYVTWSDTALGAVMVVPVTGGIPRRVTLAPGRYANPVWSPDGRSLAFLQDTTSAQQKDGKKFPVFYVSAFEQAHTPRQVLSVGISENNRFRFYPSVSFSGDGARLFYVEQTGEVDYFGRRALMSQCLASVLLDGSDRREHLRFPWVDEVAVSPDGRWVAFARFEQVMVIPLPQRPKSVEDLLLDGPHASVTTLAREGGSYIGWQDSSTVTWNAANQIYRQRVKSSQSELVVDVDLRIPRARASGIVAFTNARLITMKGDEVIANGIIVVDHDRILSVGPNGQVTIPNGAKVIDATGATIMPGLADMHAHYNEGMREIFKEKNHKYIGNLAYGVTTIFDPSAPTLDTFARAEMVEVGAMLGPRIFSSGIPIMAGQPEKDGDLPLQSLDHAREVVKRYGKYQPSLLKQYMQPRREQRQWLAQAAREAGMRITAEGNSFALDLTLISDGYTAFEHAIWTRPVYEDVVQFIARSGVHMTPEKLICGMSTYYGAREYPADDSKLRRFFPEENLARYRNLKFGDLVNDARWLNDAKLAARIVHAGGLINTGTHGFGSSLGGLGIHWEIWGFVEGGMTAHEALRTATYVPAQKLGMERDLGSLEPGKLADFLVLDRNPLEDIRNTVAMRYVIMNGFVYDGETLERRWPAGNHRGDKGAARIH